MRLKGIAVVASLAAVVIAALTWNGLTTTVPASGTIVIVSVGDDLIAETGGWPWPRNMQAKLLDRLTDAGVKRTAIYFDLSSAALDPDGDHALAAALARAGNRTILPALPAATTGYNDLEPIPELRVHAWIACDTAKANGGGMIFEMAPNCSIAGKMVPSLAAALAGRQAGDVTKNFWRYDLASVPVISAKQILAGKIPRAMLAGLTIVVAPTESRDWITGPDHRRLPAAYVPVLAAEQILRKAG